MSRLTRILLGAAVGGLVVTGGPQSGNAREDIIVTLTQPGQTEPFALFRCEDSKPCVGDALFEKDGVKLPLHFVAGIYSAGVSFDYIECAPLHWHFSLLNDDGSGPRFHPGTSTGTLVLDDLGGVINPAMRKPFGEGVGKVVVGLYGTHKR